MRRPSPIERVAKIEDARAAVHAHVHQRESDPVFTAVEWLSAGLMNVQRGAKLLRRGDEALRIEAGDFVWLSPGTRVEVRNVIDDDGAYVNEGLIIAPELLVEGSPSSTQEPALARGQARFNPRPRLRRIGANEHPALADAHRRCIEGLRARLPDGVLRARILELVAWLAELGVDLGASFSARLVVKRLVSREPGRPWSLGEVARAVAMSEDTLHRRLASEDTSFSEVLTGVRMDHAVSLLWKTDLPVGHVALEAGYTSASRFATRFNERFGILPSRLRERRPGRRLA